MGGDMDGMVNRFSNHHFQFLSVPTPAGIHVLSVPSHAFPSPFAATFLVPFLTFRHSTVA